jgi:multiple sugar transport system permease protein
MATKKSRDKTLYLAWGVLAIYFFFIFIPFFFTFLTSLKPTNEITHSPVSYFFSGASFNAYYRVIVEHPYGRYIFNTLLISLTVVFFSAIIGIPAAYALARYEFPLKGPILLGSISIRLIPPISLIVPFFLFIRMMRGIDTLWSLILVNLLLNLPFFIWISWGFFKELPWELEEAALLDGCSRLETLWRVSMPIAAPGLAASAIVTFMFTWNEYLFALTFSQSAASKTVSVGISDFVGDVFVRWNLISAAGIITTIPALIFVFVFQKYIVQGLTSGSVKG